MAVSNSMRRGQKRACWSAPHAHTGVAGSAAANVRHASAAPATSQSRQASRGAAPSG